MIGLLRWGRGNGLLTSLLPGSKPIRETIYSCNTVGPPAIPSGEGPAGVVEDRGQREDITSSDIMTQRYYYRQSLP